MAAKFQVLKTVELVENICDSLSPQDITRLARVCNFDIANASSKLKKRLFLLPIDDDATVSSLHNDIIFDLLEKRPNAAEQAENRARSEARARANGGRIIMCGGDLWGPPARALRFRLEIPPAIFKAAFIEEASICRRMFVTQQPTTQVFVAISVKEAYTSYQPRKGCRYVKLERSDGVRFGDIVTFLLQAVNIIERREKLTPTRIWVDVLQGYIEGPQNQMTGLQAIDESEALD